MGRETRDVRGVPSAGRGRTDAQDAARPSVRRGGEKRRIVLDRRVYVAKYKRCSPECAGCPHGPYWYQAYRVKGKGEGLRYIGKDLTAALIRKRVADALEMELEPDLPGMPERPSPEEATRPWWFPEDVWGLVLEEARATMGDGGEPGAGVEDDRA